jgi:DNA-binding SARP family transcriptional activator
MEFRILGPIEVWDGAEQLDLGGSKPRALLAVLLLHANEVVSTDKLVDELWGEAPPPTARNLIQVYVSRLRQALQCRGEGGAATSVLVTRPSGYLLRVEPGELDLDRFEGLAADARRAIADGDLERAAECWRSALAVWRGSRLPAAPRRRCSGPLRRAWRRPAWWRWRSAWRLTCASASTPSWSASWRDWWPPTPTGSAYAGS